MNWENDFNSGSLRYSPNISAEKITDTTSQAFMNLCRSEGGRQLAIIIIDNFIYNGTKRNSQQLLERNPFPKQGSAKKLSKTGGEIDED